MGNNGVRRLYVEKKGQANAEAKGMYKELTHNLHIRGLSAVRLLVRYDVQFLSDDEYALAVQNVLTEPPVDQAYPDTFPHENSDRILAIELLPGQYDQRADSAAQCIQLLTGGEKPRVRAARVWVFSGDLSDSEFLRMKEYLVNPVDSQEVSLAPYQTLDLQLEPPEKVPHLTGFITMDTQSLASFRSQMGLAMDMADLLFCQNYFANEEERDPTLTEIRMIDTYWSDHCRHTTFLTHLTDIQIEEDCIRKAFEDYLVARQNVYGDKQKPLTLMDVATISAKSMRKAGGLQNLDVSEEINACTIIIPVEVQGKTQEYLLLFKNETHNHPTEIEPFGGAATCLGGAIRDPLSGRAYVYQAMRITGSADPRLPVEKTIPGKLPQRRITLGAAAGYSSYGNQIGLATGMVKEIYHPGYVAKRMELGAVIGAVPRDQVVREVPDPGDVVVLLGGRTGRDGCGGATGSSKAHTQESLSSCGAEVQKGNPPEERKIQRLFRNSQVTRMIKRCNDFGAGGVSVAIGELADGLSIDLDRVPKKYEGLSGTELAISESQERMAVVIAPQDVDAFLSLAHQENLEATVVAQVTKAPRLVMKWQGDTICDIHRDFLNTNGASKTATAQIAALNKDELLQTTVAKGDLRKAWLCLLSDLNICSQQGLGERFDASIGAGSVLMPYGGKTQRTPTESMVAKIPVLQGQTDTATIMAHGYNPVLSSRSPFHGALYAIVESVAKVVAGGAPWRQSYLTLQEYFERLGEDATRWGKPLAALLGAFTAQNALGLAAVGGKDSMSGSFMDLDVPPTLVSLAVCPTKASKTVSPELKGAGHDLFCVIPPYTADALPDFDVLKKQWDVVSNFCQQGQVLSAHTIGMGGLCEALTKMSFGNQIGFELDQSAIDFFATFYGGMVLELASSADCSALISIGGKRIGTTTANDKLTIGQTSLSIEEAYTTWATPLQDVFPECSANSKGTAFDAKNIMPYTLKAVSPIAKPRVFIPVFPGTNCEYDSQRVFERAGAVVDTFVFQNLSPADIASSVDAMLRGIGNAQIVMLPGGFSGGDEPDGSGKFIAAVLRNPHIKDALHTLLRQRDGLMLGICNGFQALIKLGLVPYGEIRDLQPHDPTLTFNTIGRHISRMVTTTISSTHSPWLAGCKVGDQHVIAVSHGEGRLIASDDQVRSWIAAGQVATQYVDEKGNPTYDSAFNPNQSVHAIEGLLSPDGRVLGKMGHSERIGDDLYRNIVGEFDQKLFSSGVGYYR